MNKLTRISQEMPSPIVLEHPIVNRPKWLTVSELVPAWAKELADARTSGYEFEDKLSYHLEKDVINGFLDDPLRNGSRLGLRVIGPGGQPMYIEGRQLYGLFRTMERDILLSKEALLEFARRHKVRPPSWCDASKGEIQPSRLPGQLKPSAPTAMILEAIRCAYDAAEAARRKPPNIKELPAAVELVLDRKGFSASKRRIQLLGEAEEFKRRRRPPGKTLKSERPK